MGRYTRELRNRFGLKVLLAVVGMLWGSLAFAADYYIAPASSAPSGWGNGVNGTNDVVDGRSQSNPYATLTYLFSRRNLATGDKVYIAAGTYSETAITVGSDDEGFTLQGASLSNGVPTTIFSGASASRWLLINDVNNDNITIDNIKIMNYTTTGAAEPDGGAGIKIKTGATGLIITDCYFENCFTNTIHRGGAIYAEEGISVSNTVFYDNYAAYYGGAVSIEVTTSVSSFTKCTFSYNTTNAYDGFVIYNGVAQTCTITNCLFYSNGGSVTTSKHSARGASANGAVTAKNGIVKIINTTLYGNSGSGCGGLYTNGGTINATNCIINNNTGSTKGDAYKNAGTLNLTNCSYTGSTIGTMSSNSSPVTGSPSFVNAGSDFRILSTSNCRNTGSGTVGSGDIPSDDIVNSVRYGTPDIGCYESCGAQTPGTPTSNSPQCLTNVTITKNGNAAANNAWFWQTSSTGTSTSLPATSDYSAASSGTYYINSYLSTESCFGSAASIAILINANPTTSAAGADLTIPTCGSVKLGANTASVGTGAWTVTSGLNTSTGQFSSTSSPNAVFTPAGGAGTYVLRWTISNSPCTASYDELTVEVSGSAYSGTLTVGASG